jgi:hypothetical protein
MADPILPGVIRVLAIWQGVSALPEDRYISTFAFSSDAASTTAAQNAAIDKVVAFYDSTNAGGRVGQYMSGQVINEALSEFRAYDLGDPPFERTPLIRPNTTVVMGSGTGLPSEVAVCLSYYQTRNRPRRRGRIYVGPLNISAVSGVGNTVPRVVPEFQNTLLAAGLAMASPSTSPQFCFVAQQDATTAPIARVPTHMWVDNAFDTQHRRGEKASARVTGVTTITEA